MALLELKRVMKVSPVSGVLEPYDKFPITFSCHSKAMNKDKGFYHSIMGEEGLNEMS
jgi:hypothetical protein